MTSNGIVLARWRPLVWRLLWAVHIAAIPENARQVGKGAVQPARIIRNWIPPQVQRIQSKSLIRKAVSSAE